MKKCIAIFLASILLTSCSNTGKKIRTNTDNETVTSTVTTSQKSSFPHEKLVIPIEAEAAIYIGNPLIQYSLEERRNDTLAIFLPSKKKISPDKKGIVTFGNGTPKEVRFALVDQESIVSLPVYLSSQKIDWKLWESRLAQVEKDKTANKASWKKDLDNLRKEIKQFDDQVDQLNAVWSEPWELYQANVPLFHNEKVEQEVKEVSLSFDGKNYKAQLNNIRSAPNKHLGIESNKALKLNNYLAFDRQMISEGTDNLVFSPKLDQEFHAQEEVEITEFTFFPNEITLANLQGELVAANGTALWSRSWAEGSRWKIPKGSTLKITYEVKHPKMIQENFTQVNLTSYVHYQNKGKEFTHSWDDEGHNKFSAKDVLLLQKYNLDPRRATHFLKKIQAIGSK